MNFKFEQSKLIVLLAKLSDVEFKELGLWLESPLLNRSSRARLLYGVLDRKFRKRNKPPTFQKLLVYLNIISKETKRKEISPRALQNYRKLASELTLQVEDFLVWKQTQKNKKSSNQLLMDNLLDKKLYSLLPPLLKKTKKQQSTDPIRDINYCINKYKLAETEFYMDVLLRHRRTSESMKNVVDSLRVSCLSQLLRYYCALSNFKNLLVSTDDFPFMEIVKNYVSSSSDLEHFTVNIYYKLLLLLENGKPADYYNFKELLFRSLSAFDVNELRQFFAFMTNYCKQMVSLGHEQFLEERFAIYETGLEIGCWTAGIYFSQHQFVEIVRTGLLLEKRDWVFDFIEDNQCFISPAFQQDIVNFSLSLLLFYDKNYDRAQFHLSQISKTEDFLYHLDWKVLLMKIYYEYDLSVTEDYNYHPIHYDLEAFRVYTSPGSGKKMAEPTREMYSNFALLFKQILKQKGKLIKKETLQKGIVSILQTKLINLKPITERNWLGEKILELE